MSTQTFTRDDGQLVIETDDTVVTGMVTKPDRGWRLTDTAGHRHAYWDESDPYPTLVLKRDEPAWCGDCQDEHAEQYYACKECGERIAPATRSVEETRQLRGMTTYMLTTTREVSREEAEAWLNGSGG